MTATLGVENPATLAPLRRFVQRMALLLDETRDEAVVLAKGGSMLAELVATDDWLPDSHAVPDPARYQQYLLYRDPNDRFSLVSFVWGPGQRTPIHDHTVWGLIGMLRGSEISQSYEHAEGGLRETARVRLDPGQIDAVSPTIGDLHLVSNAYDERASISIHVYGADIGKVKRATYDVYGNPKPFVSGYAPSPALTL